MKKHLFKCSEDFIFKLFLLQLFFKVLYIVETGRCAGVIMCLSKHSESSLEEYSQTDVQSNSLNMLT